MVTPTFIIEPQILNKKTENSVSVEYTDSNEIEQWAVEAVQNLTMYEIITGNDGKFRPHDNITRAEAAVILFRTLEFVQRGDSNE